jgi:hypothetical protein
MHRGVANTLDKNDVTTIIATAEFFGAEMSDLQQIYFDLTIPRYRVFDWLGMCVMGRINCKPAVKVFAHSFLKVNGDTQKFIEDLRVTDYQWDTEWEKIELEQEQN